MLISFVSSLLLNFLCGSKLLRCGQPFVNTGSGLVSNHRLTSLLTVNNNKEMGFNGNALSKWINPETFLRVPELIRRNGFPVEIHDIVAEDGFINTVHRIPNYKGRAVYLLHGNYQSSADWLLNGRNGSLAYILAMEGYDVWLGNGRGNFYSNKHVNLTRRNRKYWDFSFQEMAVYDFPAVVDYILDFKTRETSGAMGSSLNFIGFSMGTTVYFCALSLKPELNDKIKLGINLGPAAYAHNWRTPIRFLVHSLRILEVFNSVVGDNVLRPDFWFNLLHQVAPFFCTPLALESVVCRSILFFITGFDQDGLDFRSLPLITGHSPSAISSKNNIHVLQIMRSQRFQLFDYRRRRNLQKYGQPIPPEYPLHKIRAKTALIWGKNDWVADEEDVALLAPQLPNLVYYAPVNYSEFNHVDFVYGKRARELVYDTCLDLMRRYN